MAELKLTTELASTPDKEWDINAHPDKGTPLRLVNGRVYARVECTPGGFHWIELEAKWQT